MLIQQCQILFDFIIQTKFYLIKTVSQEKSTLERGKSNCRVS